MIKLVRIAVLSAAVLMSGSALSQGVERDLADLECRDVMLFSGSDRDITVMALHAFLMGKAGTSKYSVEKLARSTDSFLEYCIENPGKNAIGAMQQYVEPE